MIEEIYKEMYIDKALQDKYILLKDYLSSLGSVAVAFSGGVDSTFLLFAAKDALGDRAIAVTATAIFVPARESEEAKEYCKSIGVKQFIINPDELSIEGFAHNPKNRCYICKKQIFEKIKHIASEQGISQVVEGSNVDDTGDYRPGMQAIAELQVKSPLRDCGLTKQDIRDLSRYYNIPTWKKPSFACLASRFPYGEVINEKKLKMVERSEQLLMDMGFEQFRVRIHGEVARIEIDPNDFDKIMTPEAREKIYKCFKEYGFAYVALDLLGYRTGSMNETIQ